MNLPEILLWGFIATAVLTTILSASQGLGLTRMGLPFILGTVFTGDRGRAGVAGFGVHFAIGLVIAVGYALVFESVGRATWWLGALLGALHGFFVLTAVLPLLPGLHPRMATEHDGPNPTRRLQPPGFMGLHYGRRTPIVELAAHVAYGVILGAFYPVAA